MGGYQQLAVARVVVQTPAETHCHTAILDVHMRRHLQFHNRVVAEGAGSENDELTYWHKRRVLKKQRLSGTILELLRNAMVPVITALAVNNTACKEQS